MAAQRTERVETVVVGGGQAGLAVGYHLERRNRPFVILDAGARVGDAWRKRWPSLQLYSPALVDAARVEGLDEAELVAVEEHSPRDLDAGLAAERDELELDIEALAGRAERREVVLGRATGPDEQPLAALHLDRAFAAHRLVAAVLDLAGRERGFAHDRRQAAIAELHLGGVLLDRRQYRGECGRAALLEVWGDGPSR